MASLMAVLGTLNEIIVSPSEVSADTQGLVKYVPEYKLFDIQIVHYTNQHTKFLETTFIEALAQDPPKVLTVTRVLREKNAGTLLEAVMNLESIAELRIVGIATSVEVGWHSYQCGGYLATIVIPMLFGFEDVPFRFSACSEDCKEIVDHRFEAIQSQRTYLNPAKESYAHLEPYHIWTLRRLSKLGCYTDMSLRVNPNQLAKDLDLNLVDDDAIIDKDYSKHIMTLNCPQ
eukprot:Em0006g1a